MGLRKSNRDREFVSVKRSRHRIGLVSRIQLSTRDSSPFFSRNTLFFWLVIFEVKTEILNQMVDNFSDLDLFNQMVKQNSRDLDLVFQALAHPVRRAMLGQLVAGECNLTELAAPLKMSFPAVSKHVRVLERARLVRRRISGRTHFCRIEGKPLSQANRWIEEFRKVWDANFNRLDDLLDELKANENSTQEK